MGQRDKRAFAKKILPFYFRLIRFLFESNSNNDDNDDVDDSSNNDDVDDNNNNYKMYMLYTHLNVKGIFLTFKNVPSSPLLRR